MAKYTIFADVIESEFQNVQDLATIWADIRHDVDRLDGELVDAYAVLGDWDFQLTYEVESDEDAMKVALAIERHGLDTKTQQVLDVERFGGFVEDI